MKKNISLLLAGIVLSLLSGTAGATVYTFQPTPRADLRDLNHAKYYTWGIDWSAPVGESVSSASLFFDDIRNHDSQPNDLWVHLLDTAATGVKIGTDNQSGGDYFAGQGVLLNHWQNLPNTAQDILYNFHASEVAALGSYTADGNFGLGFDPDCHFKNRGITLMVSTDSFFPPAATPEPGTLLLFGSGLIVMMQIAKRWKKPST